MSGGHYDYAYSQMEQLAGHIKEDCDRWDKPWKDGWGEYDAMPADILAHMRWVAQQIETLADAAKDIEWLMSSDIGDDTLRERCESWKLSQHLRP